MAETEIPQDVVEAAGRFADEIETTRDGFRTGRWLLVRNMQVNAIMADRAARAPDRDVLVEALRESVRAARYLIERQRDQINGKPVRDLDEAWVAWTSANGWDVTEDVVSQPTCEDCGGPVRVWFALNQLWNLVKGGPAATDDPGGMLCPNCFIDRAEAAGIKPTAWVIDREQLPVSESQADYEPRTRSALSAPAERGVEEPVWRTDFASAPRDGSWVELRSPNGDAQRLFWSTHYSINGLGGCWTEGFVTMSDFDFTGWRTAPPPPAGMVLMPRKLPPSMANVLINASSRHTIVAVEDVWELLVRLAAAPGQPAQGDGTDANQPESGMRE